MQKAWQHLIFRATGSQFNQNHSPALKLKHPGSQYIASSSSSPNSTSARKLRKPPWFEALRPCWQTQGAITEERSVASGFGATWQHMLQHRQYNYPRFRFRGGAWQWCDVKKIVQPVEPVSAAEFETSSQGVTRGQEKVLLAGLCIACPTKCLW
jgi:hypothetical protein